MDYTFKDVSVNISTANNGMENKRECGNVSVQVSTSTRAMAMANIATKE